MDRRTLLLSAWGLVASPAPATDPAPSGLAATTDPLFDAWAQGFVDRAAGAGWPRERLVAIFSGLQADPRVIADDRRQPELSKPIGDYVRSAVSSSRVEEGTAHRQAQDAWLAADLARYGVPPEILVAIWGMESSFGRVQGDYDVIRSLATLAAEGRRKEWAEGQLFSALRILITGEATHEQLKGSWAGAMGQTQFTPQDYLSWAVDGDGDGRRDIWGSAPDALASSANFLANKAAWRRGESWAREVLLPQGFDYSLSEGPKQAPPAWTELGVRPADGFGFSEADAAAPAALILPAGWSGPAFLTFPNHQAIRAYNNSMAYALSVGLLADRIAGGSPLVRPWPEETPIPLADRVAAQEALARLGFDPGVADGVLGLKTREAARAWQKSRSLPADGYLTYGLVLRLKGEAGVGAGAVPGQDAPSAAAPSQPPLPAPL
jgi:membrane-bound lytic murein transglycosylase B